MFVALAAAGAAIDVAIPQESVALVYGLFGLFTLYLQLLLTGWALEAMKLVPCGYDPRRPTMGRYPTAVGQSLLWAVAVLAGLLLLVIPGLVLLVRWTVSLPALLSEDLGIAASLRRSWALTARRWPLALAMLLVAGLIYAPSLALDRLLYPFAGALEPRFALAANLVHALGATSSPLLFASLYAALRAEVEGAAAGA
jgi:hypothetical protein